MQAAREAILAAFPELAGARFTEMADGWESLAIDVDDALISRFPRLARGHAQLAREARLLAPDPAGTAHPGQRGADRAVRIAGEFARVG